MNDYNVKLHDSGIWVIIFLLFLIWCTFIEIDGRIGRIANKIAPVPIQTTSTIITSQ
jgi:hypothetical protein